MLGLGLSIPRCAVRAGDALTREVASILAKYGTDAHLYLPGIGVINGLTAGNYLDSAGTTAATVDNPVGKVDDAAGAIDATQATTANKPILRSAGGINSWEFADETDELVSDVTTFGADMDCFVAMYRPADTLHCVGTSQYLTGAFFFGMMHTGQAAACNSGSGTPTYKVNGVSVTGGTAVTRHDLAAAAGSGAWKVIETCNLNLTDAVGWTKFAINGYPNFGTANSIGVYIIIPAMTAAERNIIRTWCGSLVGLTL